MVNASDFLLLIAHNLSNHPAESDHLQIDLRTLLSLRSSSILSLLSSSHLWSNM